MIVVLIACVGKKKPGRAMAKELYASPWFRYAWRYGQSLNPGKVFILSAKHGLLDPETAIDPYEETLNAMQESERRAWAMRVLATLRDKTDVGRDRYVILAGANYRKYLVGALRNHSVPMEGLAIGQQLKWLGERCVRSTTPIEAICERLHALFSGFERQRFPFDPSHISSNGLYVLFEKGEGAHGGDRIVRIGTHTGQGNLAKRLGEHLLRENKDRSIFRKNIGRALLNRDRDPFIKQWNLDMMTRAAKQEHGGAIDRSMLLQTEKRVSAIIRENFAFCVVGVDGKNSRCEPEKRLIASINHRAQCAPSPEWLGRHSPIAKIRQSGLWLVQGLNGPLMSAEDLEAVERLVR